MVAAGTGMGTGTGSATGVVSGAAAAGAVTTGTVVVAAGGEGGALETEPNPCAAAIPAPGTGATSSRQSIDSVEARFDVMARDFIAARVILLCDVSRSAPQSPSGGRQGLLPAVR
jgi:hypothetical protein